MTITFRAVEPPTAADISQIVQIEKEAFGDNALGEYTVVPMLRYGKVFTAVDEQGYAIACAYFMRNMNDTAEAYLVSIAVLPRFRGKDVGTELLRYAFDFLAGYGITQVRLTVDPANFNALSVYREKLGFTVVESAKDEYGAGEDRLVMVKALA